jgi:hypothetical protein
VCVLGLGRRRSSEWFGGGRGGRYSRRPLAKGGVGVLSRLSLSRGLLQPQQHCTWIDFDKLIDFGGSACRVFSQFDSIERAATRRLAD